MMTNENAYVHSASSKLIFACSGAADVGAVSDLAARKLTSYGIGKMSCLAGVGGRVEGILKATGDAKQILAIDGCPLDCAKLCLEQAGFDKFDHMRVTDLGLTKGKTTVNNTVVAKVAQHGEEILS